MLSRVCGNVKLSLVYGSLYGYEKDRKTTTLDRMERLWIEGIIVHDTCLMIL